MSTNPSNTPDTFIGIPATPQAQRNTRQKQAENWFLALAVIAAISTVAAAPVFGSAFGETVGVYYTRTEFNWAAAFGGAVATALAWLPFIAILDVLRRDVSSESDDAE